MQYIQTEDIKMKLSNAPRWILDAHKIPATDVILDYNENSKKFYVRNEHNVNYENIDLSTLETSTVNELYEVLIDNNIKFRFGSTVLKKYSFTDSVVGRTIVVPAHNGYTQMMFDNSDYLLLKTQLGFIQDFIDNEAKAYHENPKDFIAAYEFINQHPAFWVKFKTSKTDFMWSKEEGISGMWQTFYRDDDGDIICLMETGEHESPEYEHLAIRQELNTYASTYEKAIILLARSIAQTYYDNGDLKKK